jgi:hypothetical protein
MPQKNDRSQDYDESQQAPLLQLSHEPASPAQLAAWQKLWGLLLSDSGIPIGAATGEREDTMRDDDAPRHRSWCAREVQTLLQ